MFELQSIQELNQRLSCLALSVRPGGFPTHINLQLNNNGSNATTAISPSKPVMERQIQRLKDQNRMLTEEVGRKSNHITNLEQEKSALIKQLFQARSAARAHQGHANQQHPMQRMMQQQQQTSSSSANDTTFM